ncbi:MAG: response regulator [Nitrospiraceae bacterium]|nr:MAG: response regulator [Nitrospiraceae bacterium]
MKQKIILSLFALFIFLAAGTVTAVLYMSNNTSVLKNIVMLHEVEQLRRSLIIKIQNVQADLYTVDKEFATDFDYIINQAADLDQTAMRCSGCHHSPELTKKIQNVQSLINDYEVALSYYLTASANTNRIIKLKSDAAAIGKKLINLSGAMSHSASKNLAELSNETMSRMHHVMTILLITIAITFILGILVAIHLTRSVTNPVNELVHATRRIASGEYGAKISFKDKTEFGELAEHFNSMSRAIKEGYEKIHKEMADRKQAEDALRLSEERLQTVFNQMQDVFYRTDKEDRIIWVSPSSKKMFGYNSVDNIIGQKFSNLCTNPEKKQIIFNELINKGNIKNYELEMLKSDNSTIIVSINSHFYLDEKGEVAGIEGAIRDVTEQKKLEEEHRTIEKLESVGILAGGIAHDFNNILTSITGNISLARLSHSSRKDVSDILAEVEEACGRARDLTNQLLAFAKGGFPIKKIVYLRNQIKDATKFALRGSKVKCEFQMPLDLWAAEIDPGQINQVIYNLVINANQAMPDGGTINICAENMEADEVSNMPLERRDYVKISVRDHGIGIPGDQVQKVFDPYFTTKKQGSGLGLSSTYTIIKNHNGHIDVESEEGKGTIFRIYLPASRKKLPDREIRDDDVIMGSGKILVMDDDQSVRDTVKKMLSHMGYEVETVRDGTEAIELYNKCRDTGSPFDAVIMDLTIRGGMGGGETITKLTEIDPEVKAIVSSGYSTDTVMSNYEEYGFRGVISKPYDMHDLSTLLHQLVNGKKG